MEEVLPHPNLKARGSLIDTIDFSKWDVKKASIPGPLIKLSESKGSAESIGPEFGVHNKEIYCNLLNFTEDDLKAWKKRKIILIQI